MMVAQGLGLDPKTFLDAGKYGLADRGAGAGTCGADGV